MHNLSFALQAAWKVLLVGLLLGAGPPALFAVGVRSMAYGQGGDAAVGATARAAHRVGRLVAALCFLVVAMAVVLGVAYVVATGSGLAIGFEHGVPTLTEK